MKWAVIVLRDHLGKFVLTKIPDGREPEDRLMFPTIRLSGVGIRELEGRNELISHELTNLLGIVIPQEDLVHFGTVVYCENGNELKLSKIDYLLPIGSIQKGNPRFREMGRFSICELSNLAANNVVDPNALWIAATSLCPRIGNLRTEFTCYYDEYD